MLSDADLRLARALRLPTFDVAGQVLLKRMALDDGRITNAFYPVFPPDRSAAEVLDWLERNPQQPANSPPATPAE